MSNGLGIIWPILVLLFILFLLVWFDAVDPIITAIENVFDAFNPDNF